MGFFTKLFQNIDTDYSDDVKAIYNFGVLALAEGNILEAISYFKQIEKQHSSAAYNLGLIYLDGVGISLPDYDKARYYFQLAKSSGHKKAKKSAQIIGLKEERIINLAEYRKFLPIAVQQFALGRQMGNLAYMIANDVIFHVIENSTNQLYSAKRFIDYEVWCIRKYASEEVNHFYQQSVLKDYLTCYDYDWEEGETAKISDYLNDSVFTNVMALSDGKFSFFELGVPRLIAVNYIYSHCAKKYSPILM